MTSASTDRVISVFQVDVWLDVGRDGRCFTYLDSRGLGVNSGDLVLVRLRGRPMHGLVVGRRIFESKRNDKEIADKELNITQSFLEIEALLQVAAVDIKWREWLEEVAVRCHISSFRMIKAALPPGWLGQQKKKLFKSRKKWWVFLDLKGNACKKLSPRQLELEKFLLSSGNGAWQTELNLNGFSYGIIKALILNGRAKREYRDDDNQVIKSYYLKKKNNSLESPKPLTNEQKIAINIFNSLDPGKSLLLWGVTGSGKTEVYLQIAAKELNEGRCCLILAPEIGLIPQLVDRFIRRFGESVFEYHSGCAEKERVATWQRCLKKDSPFVIVGTRSAIFLPISPLGLIVLDEEHDPSYKQQSPMPCYHARDIALDRCKKSGTKLILGSATPSLKTWKCLSPEGDIAIAKLTRRISEQSLPKVCVIDMRQEFAEGHKRLISRPVMEKLALLPESKEQAVILVPRRGYSSFLSCRSCGDVVQCPHCDVALTVHKGKNRESWLRCHWCNYRGVIQSVCSNCGSTAFKPFGAGTQRIMESLCDQLQGLRFLRFDRDTTRGRDGHREVLEKFASGQADVLIGTQMLAKGMDLPRVTLAIVLAADGLLHRPDLLAGEQSLQLFMQLAGRAGRGEKPGKFLIQTYCPEHPVILHLVDGRYEEFLRKEAKIRQEAGLMPYARACLIRLSGESNAITATAASAIAEQIRPLCNLNRWMIIGPAPSLIPRVADKSRWQILLHGPEDSDLPLPPDQLLWKGLPKGVALSVDPDPLQL